MTPDARTALVVVYCVICRDTKFSYLAPQETLHIFSTADKRLAFMDTDDRDHIAYDYTLDHPERHEGELNDN